MARVQEHRIRALRIAALPDSGFRGQSEARSSRGWELHLIDYNDFWRPEAMDTNGFHELQPEREARHQITAATIDPT